MELRLAFQRYHLDSLRTGHATLAKLDALLAWFGKPLVTITRQDVREYMRVHAATPAKANRGLSVLKTYGDCAIEWSEDQADPAQRYVPVGWANPCRGIKRYPEPKRDRVLSQTEVDRLRAALTPEPAHIRAYFLVLLATGCRLSEALVMRWVDLAWQELRVEGRLIPAGRWTLLRTKNGDRHSLLLIGPALEAVRLLPVIGPYIFSCEGTKPYDDSRVGQWWDRIRARAGLDDVRVHDLRHAAATYLVSDGVPLDVVSALLNHRDVKTTQRYVGRAAYLLPMQEALVRLSDRLEDGLRSP